MPPRLSAFHRFVVIASGLVAAALAHAKPTCGAEAGERAPSIMVRIDNDLIGGQDEGYTGGVVLTAVSPDLDDFTTDPCLPALARWLNQGFTWWQPAKADQRTMSFALGQAIFTPQDSTRTDLVTDDRPYAAALVASLGYHGRRDHRLDSTLVRLGWVGPSARGKEVQEAVHDITGSTPFNGWSNQLRDEPVFQLQREWTRRWDVARRTDMLAHWGGSLGTLNTNVLAGGQWRWGADLPDDFGSLPHWAAGDNAAPTRAAHVPRAGWSGHVFAGIDGRWVMHNIFLDGNTWRNSHSVDRRPFVAEASYGFQLRRGEWKFQMVRYHRTREFTGQRRSSTFGSFTVSRSL